MGGMALRIGCLKEGASSKHRDSKTGVLLRRSEFTFTGRIDLVDLEAAIDHGRLEMEGA